jgi:hypothetical protein
LDGKPFDIKHRCYHFSKDIISIISEAQIEKIHFSIFDQLLRRGVLHQLEPMLLKESPVVQERILRIFIQ